MDIMDYEIIKELQIDGRKSSLKLAKKLGCSISTVSRRIKELVNNGTIQITTITNPDKFGVQTNALIMLKIDAKEADNICDKLAAQPEVHYLAVVFGRFDIVFSSYFISKDHLLDFIKTKLSHIEGVREIETMYVAAQKKVEFGWMPEYLSETVSRRKE